MRPTAFMTALIIILGVMLSAHTLRAAESEIARVTMFTGLVTLIKADESEQPVIGEQSLYPGDTLVTGQDGRVEFTFGRGDLFKLNEDSHISLDELSGEADEEQPALRLTLGHLWTRIRASVAEKFRPSLHTPTAVLGIRGTEFETVVSMDTASAVTVDEGKVAVETEQESVDVDAGKATEVEADDKVARPFAAPPREKRNWRQWRVKRQQKLLAILPERLPHIRLRFEKAADRFAQFDERVGEVAGGLDTEIETARAAIASHNRRQARQSIKKINTIEKRFRQKSARFRKGLNRLRVASRHSIRLERFVKNNIEHLPPDKVGGIQTELTVIRQTRKQLKQSVRDAIQRVKAMGRKLRAFRQELKKVPRTQRQRKRP
ncbi:MAG: hypothetical protein GY697_03765 [Desulfobacterales bacterium]|nr:hypothetical protein [Desulfobacterales bacterium]